MCVAGTVTSPEWTSPHSSHTSCSPSVSPAKTLRALSWPLVMTTASSRYSARISSSASLRFISTTGCERYLRGARPSPSAPPPGRGAKRPRGCDGCPEGDLRPLDRPEQPRLRIIKQPVDDLHDALHYRIVRGTGQEIVELGVLLRAGVAARHTHFLPAYDLLEPSQVLRRGPGGRRPRYLRLEEQPRVHELLAKGGHAVEHAGDRCHKVLDRNLPDVVAPAVAALDETRHLELAYGLPYHSAAHLELLGELALRG